MLSSNLPTFLIILLELVIPALVIAAGYCIGSVFLRWIKTSFDSVLAHLFISLLLGYCGLAVFTWVVGLLGLLYSEFFWGFLAAVLFFGRLKLRALVGDLAGLNIWGEIKSSPLNCFSCGIFAVASFFALSVALLPIGSVDSSAYSLGIGVLFKTNHEIFPVEFMQFGTRPHFSQMLFLFSTMLFDSSIPPYLFNLQIFFLALLGIFLILRNHVSSKFALLGSAIFCVCTDGIFRLQFIECKPQFFFVALGLAAFFCLIKYINEKTTHSLILLGLVLGFEANTVMMTGFMPLIGISSTLVAVALYSKSFDLQKALKDTLILILFTVLMAVPWYFQQVWYRGEPFYPFKILQMWSTGDFSAIGDTVGFNKFVFHLFLPENPTFIHYILAVIKGFFGFFWRMTFEPETFQATLTISFLFVFFCIPFMKKSDFKLFFPAGIYGLSLYTMYLFGPTILTTNLLLFAVASVLGALIVENVYRHRIIAGRIILGVLIAILVFDVNKNYISPAPFGGFKNYHPIIFNVSKRKEFLNAQTLGAIDTLEYINDIQEDSRIFIHPLIPGYYLKRDYVWGHKVHAGKFIGYSQMNHWVDLLDRLKSLNVTHILINKYMYGGRSDFKDQLPDQWAFEVATQSAYFLYGSRPPTAIYSVYKLAYDADIEKKEVSSVFEPAETEQGKFIFKIDNYSPDKEYQVEGYLETGDSNEFKAQSPGDLFIRPSSNEESLNVGRVYLNINSKIVDGRMQFRFLITPYISGDGKYTFLYKHYPSFGAVRLTDLKINVY